MDPDTIAWTLDQSDPPECFGVLSSASLERCSRCSTLTLDTVPMGNARMCADAVACGTRSLAQYGSAEDELWARIIARHPLVAS